MRVLILHNYYRLRGGEQGVVNAEQDLLESHGHEVRRLTFDNEHIPSGVGKWAAMLRSIHNSSSYRQTRAVLEEFRPDVMHVHNTFYVASPSVYKAARDCGVPVVQSLHNFRLICPSIYLMHNGQIYEESVQKTFPVDAIRKRVTHDSFVQSLVVASITATHKIRGTYRKSIDRYIVFTEFAKSIFLQSSLGVPADRFAIKPNFIQDPGWDEDSKGDFYTFVGRLSPEKGINVLLKAALNGDFKLKILGDGPLKDDVIEASRQREQIEYLGLQGRESVLNTLRQSRGLIFPSLWYEGMPLVIVEALASGCPVVVSKLGNPGHMIEDRVSGLHFEPGDAMDLVRQVQHMEDQADLRRSLGQGARQAYEDHYTPERNYDSLLQIYNDVVREPLGSRVN